MFSVQVEHEAFEGDILDQITGGDSLEREFDGPWASDVHDAREAVLWTLAAYRSQDEGRAITRDEVLGM